MHYQNGAQRHIQRHRPCTAYLIYGSQKSGRKKATARARTTALFKNSRNAAKQLTAQIYGLLIGAHGP